MYLGERMPEMRGKLREADGAAEDSTFIIESQMGLQQGDPLGPLFYALAQTDALHPQHDGSEQTAVTPHVAYLDDTNLMLPQTVDAAVIASVTQFFDRLAAEGLEINRQKSLFVARSDHSFSEAEQTLIHSLGIPYTDASAATQLRGFTTVGVPVGHADYVGHQLRLKLFEPGLWRFAWHLRGMAQDSCPLCVLFHE